jgi:hypothetical protein
MSDELKYARVTPQGLELARRLEHLLELPLNDSTDLEPWDQACKAIETWLEAHHTEVSVEVPPSLFHYFVDSDIHLKEPEYRREQEKSVRRLIGELRGEIPVATGKPWWQFW